MNSTSPVEYLVAFGACYVAGIATVFAMSAWKKRIIANAQKDAAVPAAA